MKKYTSMTRDDANEIGREVRTLLSAWAAERGLQLVPHGGTFDGLSWRTKLEFAVATTADGRSKPQVEFEAYAISYGLEPGDFGKTFKMQGRSWTITGLNLKSRAKPVLVTRDDGKGFVTTQNAVRQALGRPLRQPFAVTTEVANLLKGEGQ